jgi:GMP synthase (glutamine-hydrolysing)
MGHRWVVSRHFRLEGQARMAESAGAESGVILLVQLDAEAPPGLIATVATRQGVALTVVDATAELPARELAAAPGLIVVGSAAVTMGRSDAIVAAISERVRADRPVLCVDAGAQLLAVALGGSVRAGQSHEFGYVDLSPTALAADDPVLRALGTGLPVMEWHDDAIDLPDEVRILARCGRGRVQAFASGRVGYGLRFHPAATAETVRRWAALRGVASNNPAIRVRIGAEIVRHQERAERFGTQVIEAWLALLQNREGARGKSFPPESFEMRGGIASPRPTMTC